MKKTSGLIIIMLICMSISAKELYMEIKLGSSPIGWYVSKTDTSGESITVNERSGMKLTVFDNAVDVEGQNLTVYDSNYNLVKFFSSIISEQMTFFSNGYTKGNSIIVKTILGNSTYYDTFDISGKTVIFNLEFLNDKMLDRDLYMFNPISREIERLTVKTLKHEEGYTKVLSISGKTTGSKVYFDGNEVIKSVSREGIVMEKTDSINTDIKRANIIDYFLIEAVGDFSNIKKATKAMYLLYAVDSSNISNYRQKQAGDTLIVSREPLFVPDSLPYMNDQYVRPNDEVREIVKSLKTGSNENILEKMMNYVHKRLNKSVVSGLVGIDEILDMNRGDCTEHAQLFASLAIAGGYECDIVTGIVYNEGAFYYHAWNRVLIDGNIYTIDAAFNQFDADVTHIQLSTGYPPSTILIGKLQENLKLEIIDKEF